jgi:DNA-3-methyladenine glycosylase
VERDAVCSEEDGREENGREEKMILPRRFYARDTIVVARELLGKLLVRRESGGKVTSGVIVETEAYPGGTDLASHSAAGITDRTRVIFGPPGHAYVYLSYGMHECLNIVAEAAGKPGCVLIRALEPVAGLDIMRKRRQRARSDRELANGPGKLAMALGVTRADYGADMTRGALTVHTQGDEVPFDIEVTPRIGLTKCADLPLRFLKLGSPFVSKGS